MTKRRIRPLPPARIARLEAERLTRQADKDRKIATRTHFIYFLVCEGHVKIGYGRDPLQRCSAAQVGNPFPVELAGIATGGEREERALHHAFRDLHVRAEWFRLDGHLAEIVNKVREINEPHSARAWLGDYMLSLNGSFTLIPAVRPHNSRHIDVRTTNDEIKNHQSVQIDAGLGAGEHVGL